MYMFDLNRRYDPPIVLPIQIKLYIPVCPTNRRPIRNMIGVVMNRLVGMGLKGSIKSGEGALTQRNPSSWICPVI